MKSDRNERNGEPSGERRPLRWPFGLKPYADGLKPVKNTMTVRRLGGHDHSEAQATNSK